jgi:hypothetical protein
MKRIHEVCVSGTKAELSDILATNPELVNFRDEDYRTPLHLASFSGNSDAVSVLASFNQTLLQPKDSNGLTPLDLAHQNGHFQLIVTISLKIFIKEVSVNRTIPEPIGCDWLIDRIKLRGYEMSKDGLCYGVGKKAQQAFFCGEIDKFNLRLHSLDMSGTAEDSNARLIALENEKDTILSKLEVAPPDSDTRELKDRLKKIRAYLIDIDAFYTGVSLYHNPEGYSKGRKRPEPEKKYLFGDTIATQINNPSSFWLTPIFLDDNPVVEIKKFTIAFSSVVEIRKYLDLLEFYLSDSTFSLTLTHSHSIELSYSPKTKWILSNGNQLPSTPFSNNEILAVAIHYAMVLEIRKIKSPHVSFTTTISSLTSDRIEINRKLNLMEQSELWLHFTKYIIRFAQITQLENLTNKGVIFDELFSLDKDYFDICTKYHDELQRLVARNYITIADIKDICLERLKLIFIYEDEYCYFHKQLVGESISTAQLANLVKQTEYGIQAAMLPKTVMLNIIRNPKVADVLRKSPLIIFELRSVDEETQNQMIEDLVASDEDAIPQSYSFS